MSCALKRLLRSNFLNSSSCFCCRFFDSGSCFLGSVFASGHHQLNCFHLNFFRNFSECCNVLGRCLSRSRRHVCHRFCVVCRLGFYFGQVCEFRENVFGPSCGDLCGFLSRFYGNSNHFLGESGGCFERVFHCFCVNWECAHHVFHDRCEILCLSHCLQSLSARCRPTRRFLRLQTICMLQCGIARVFAALRHFMRKT
jgi:hypothetical protein